MNGANSDSRVLFLEILHPLEHGLTVHDLRALFRFRRLVFGTRTLTVDNTRKQRENHNQDKTGNAHGKTLLVGVLPLSQNNITRKSKAMWEKRRSNSVAITLS